MSTAMLLTYSGIVTKVRAMQANLLKTENYQEIANLHSVPEVLKYLQNQPAYHDILSVINESRMHRGDIEKVLTQSLYADYVKLYRFSGLAHRHFLKLYMKHFELSTINYCFRIIFNHYEEPFDLNYKKPFFDKYSCIDIDKLISSRSMEEFLSALQGTEYYEPLKKLEKGNSHTLYDYNLALDLHCFTSIWKERSRVLKKSELAAYTREFGTRIDLLNLQWIYRAKTYFQMEPADIYSMIIPINLHLPRATTKALVEAPGVEAYQAEVKKCYYGKRLDLASEFSLENTYISLLTKLYAADRRNNPYSITSISTYLFFKEQEILTLTHMMEGIRYELPPDEILKHIGGVA